MTSYGTRLLFHFVFLVGLYADEILDRSYHGGQSTWPAFVGLPVQIFLGKRLTASPP